MVKITRGIRNFNYGNIRKSSRPWNGQIGIDLLGFCIFNSDFSCFRALYKLLRTYRLRGWLNDAKTFVKHYCPASDGNDEPTYTKVVQRCWNEYDIRDKEFARNLVYLIVVVENGFSPDQIDKLFGRDTVGCIKDLANFYE